MASLDDIVIKIRTDADGAVRDIEQVDDRLDRLGGTSTRTGSKLKKGMGMAATAIAGVGVAAGAAAAGGVAYATKEFMSFEQAVVNSASVTGATGKEYEKAKQSIAALARELGATTAHSAQVSADALYDLASAGYDVNKMSKETVSPMLNLASATQNDLASATQTVTSTLGQFGMGLDKAGHVSDIFMKTIASSKAQLGKLDQSLQQVGSIAASLGMDIETTNSALGTLYNQGFRAERAGTALRAILGELSAPTGKAKDVISNLGLTLEEVNPKTNDFTTIMQRLRDAGISTKQAFQIFGREAAPALMSLVNKTGEMKSLRQELRKAGGEAERIAKKQINTLGGQLKILKSQFKDLLITVGKQFKPEIKALIQLLQDWMPDIKSFIKNGIGAFKSAVQELQPVLNMFKKNVNDSFSVFKEQIPDIKKSGQQIWDALSRIGQKLKPIFDNLNTIFSQVFQIFMKFARAVGKEIRGFDRFAGTSATLSDHLDMVIEVLTKATGALAEMFKWINKHPEIIQFAAKIATLGAKASMLGITLVSKVVQGLYRTMNTLSQFGGSVMNAINRVRNAVDVLRNLGNRAYQWGRNLIGSFIDGIKAMIGRVGDAVRNVAGTVADYIGFRSPTRKGVGRHADRWAVNLVKMFSTGIRSNMDMVQQSLDRMASPRANLRGVSAGAGRTVVHQEIRPVIRDVTVREEADINRIADTVSRRIASDMNKERV